MDYRKNVLSETIVTTIEALLVLVMIWGLLSDSISALVPATAATGLVIIAFTTIRITISPDRVRAAQTSRVLKLSNRMLEYMRGGLNNDTATAACELLLPETQAVSVAMTDLSAILGYVGESAEDFPYGFPIETSATSKVIKSGEVMVFTTPQSLEREVGNNQVIQAAIIAPLKVSNKVVGTLKFYFSSPHLIDKTQLALAGGFADLVGMQLSTSELDRQSELTTKAELRALQSQINPHFLFNTINTIASLIRTDPMRARALLKEFAVFYRQTLENSEDLITVEREMQQTMRYLQFEVARFGEKRIQVTSEVEDEAADTPVPSFIIQPIVENAVNHGMKAQGTLHIDITAVVAGDDVIIKIVDDGVGMTPAQVKGLKNPLASEKGTGIAIKNVEGRLKGFFSEESSLSIDSQPDSGTTVTLLLRDAYAEKF